MTEVIGYSISERLVPAVLEDNYDGLDAGEVQAVQEFMQYATEAAQHWYFEAQSVDWSRGQCAVTMKMADVTEVTLVVKEWRDW